MHQAPEIGATAPDFSIPDVEGNTVSLEHYHGEKAILLVLNRGFN